MGDTKLVLFGEGGVGKTSLALRFCKGIFLQKYDPTVEDVFRQHISINDKVFMLEIIDTAGTDQFAIMREMYIKSGRGFILVFSLVADVTFQEIRQYHEQIRSVKEQDYPPVILVGNKLDLQDQRMVTRDQAEQLAKEFKCPYIETSTKENINVLKTFEDIVMLIHPQDREEPPKSRSKFCLLL